MRSCKMICRNTYGLILLFFMLGLASCNKPTAKKEATLFRKIPGDSSGIKFINQLSFNEDFNIYTYRNFYNGGGVAAGDINNDGLVDLYFSANQLPNRLYLNKGNFVFEDITTKAGVGGTRAWSTGVSMADVNGDGWIDIYVCNSGSVKGDDKENELFINNGDLTFSEKAAAFGLADKGYSTHTAFFDYDKDGDLDAYILNNSYQAIGSFNLQKNERGNRDPLGGHKLMRNDDNHFTDVSQEAGILGSVIAFGLGVTVGDVDNDGWQDIYVSNDFFERDYLYINNHDGTFKECLPASMKSISGASMGADMADINNDGYPDIFVTEMLPSDNQRVKTVTTFENWDRYQYSVTNGYHHQFTRNMLQMNNRDGTFSEIGRLARVEATDWSWGALMFDADNDGLKDIFVANGIYQDLTNQDYLQYASSEEFVKAVLADRKVNYEKLIEIIPSNPVPNYFFQNNGGLAFDDVSKAWGVSEPDFSNGAAYADLDNDGDLDLITNNVNMEASVYRNQAESQSPQNHYLKVVLKGSKKNTGAIGAKVTVIKAGDKSLYLEQMPMRGFESTVDARPNFGVGTATILDKVTVIWPDGNVTELDSVKANQTLNLSESDAKPPRVVLPATETKLFNLLPAAASGITFRHTENDFVDFDRDRLTYHMMSTEGPKVSQGDFNGDGLQDFFVGGAKGQTGSLYVQTAHQKFVAISQDVLKKDSESEDLGSVFFDADGDGDLDLYVCSGGNEFSTSSTALVDRLYFNENNTLRKSNQLLPTAKFESTSVSVAADYDADGDQDLFVGVRLEPFQYGVPKNGYLLKNDGNGNFSVGQELNKIGLIKDAAWADIDGDKDQDLVIVGEWMPVLVYVNQNGKLVNQTVEAGLSFSNGWWNTIEAADLDGDGDVDFVAGNHGLNSRFRASKQQPACMYVSDFDANGTLEQILCTYNGDKSYPVALRHDLIQQIPSLKKKFLKYESYKDAIITDIFSPEQLKAAIKLEAFELASGIFLNDGKGHFEFKPLPAEAQFSPMFAACAGDFDDDGKMDLLMGGNLYRAKPEVGRYDASFGAYLKGDGKGGYSSVANDKSGFDIDGEVRDIQRITIGKSDCLLVTRNNDTPLIFKINKN